MSFQKLAPLAALVLALPGQLTAQQTPPATDESRGGVEREIETGDVVVIPVGAMHAWTSIPDHVTYLSIRVDPSRVLPAGYVNPEIQ